MKSYENSRLNLKVVLLLSALPLISSYNILVVSPAVSKSHFSVGETISIGLADAGHNVTLISPYDYKPKHRNIEPVQVTGVLEKAEEMMKKQESQGIEAFTKMPVTVILPILLYYGYDLCDFTLKHENVRALYGRKYDLVIIEIFGTDSMIGLGQQFDAPVIGFSTFSTSRWTNDLIGNPSPLSYVSHTMQDFPDKMNLWNRILNIVFYGYESLILNAMSHPLQRWVYNSAFPNAKLTYDEARKNVSLIFVNSHFSLARPLPYGPNTIEVGGMHVSRNPKPLPQDIQSFLDSATDGVIYFSLGSFMKSSQFPIEKRDAFINNFAKLKQKIVWKFEDDTVPMPKNVYTGSWLPQSDILGHPNVKAFISHGGLLGTTEAIYHGVPIVGIPFFGDQHLNIKRGSQAGWAIKLNYDNITLESVEWALNEILNGKRYLENAKVISERYRDQPMTPIETMVYWSEYVIRHKGAPHLRSAGLDLNFIQYHNLDAFAVIFVFVIVFWYALKWSCLKLCCRRSKKVEKSASKQKNN
ncbi:UDP-glycosyltransferase UGT5-like isoform X1 [Bradysia coprophila]|uniref:UDP-glycosyltransferase UGT5-like isoform X1 n=1 Tax=Bradysia coprophila TaxID=38358 RepID=UPI00187D7C8E|nr:UDP-glycosyltransferase UGT5-like isoform X1 [Bradysia coprophila]